MKKHAAATRGKPSQILADAAVSVPVEVRAALGNMETVKRVIRNHKRGALPKDPASLQELIIDETWSKFEGKDFLIHDNGVGAANRVLVFGTEEGLHHLGRSSQWFMDGTFSTAPKLFSQLYVIRAPLGESTVACAYAFMKGKSQVFSALNNKCEELGFNLDPVTVNLDFELAVIKAIKSVFGEHVHIQGCFYHLTQNTWRKIQDLDLATTYKGEKDIKLFCGMMDALAFLPCGQVKDGMDYLQSICPEELEDLLAYFNTTYVNGSYKRIQTPPALGSEQPVLRMRRVAPLFPPELWNVFEATMEGGHRTNNSCEAWNHGFRQMVGHDHPSVWVALECLQKDQALVSTQLLQASRGELPQKRVRMATVSLQKKLKQLCTEFQGQQKTLPEFLHAVGHTIRLG